MDLEAESTITVDTAKSADIAQTCNKLLETQKQIKTAEEEISKLKEAERNLSESRENVIRYQCGQVEAELVPDSEGKMKILKIIKHKYEH